MGKLLVISVGLLTGFASLTYGAETMLTGGRVAKFRDHATNDKRDNATIVFARDPQLRQLLDPTCSSATPFSAVQIVTSDGVGDLIALPCQNWAVTKNGYRYRDRAAAAGGVLKVVYKFERLAVRFKGVNFKVIPGPVDYVELRFLVGAQTYCGRFETARRNQVGLVKFIRPSVACHPLPAITCGPGMECASFAVKTGSGAFRQPDDGKSSWFKITDLTGGLIGANNGTDGNFDRGPVVLGRSLAVDGNGRRSLVLQQAAFVGAPKPALSTPGKTCWRIEQDPNATGWLDCSGASDGSVSLTIDSAGLGTGGQPMLSLGGALAGPAGTGVVRVRIQTLEPNNPAADCSQLDYSAASAVVTAFTVGTVTSTIQNVRQHLEQPNTFRVPDDVVSLSGQPFDCTNWGTPAAAGSTIAAPLETLDVVPGAIAGTYDVASVLRLELQSLGAGNVATPTPGTPAATVPPTSSPTPVVVPPTPTPANTLCPTGMTCAAFNIVAGPGALTGVPGAADTFLQLFDFVGIGLSNVVDGQWSPSPILLAQGVPDASNLAPLKWLGESFLGATFNAEVQGFGSTGTVCLHIQQDPTAAGWISCNAGSNGDVAYSVNSNFEAADDPAILTLPSGADSGSVAGTALIRAQVQILLSAQNGADCRLLNWGSAQVLQTAFTTRLATSSLLQPIVPTIVAADRHGVDQNFSLSGAGFDCGTWGVTGGATASVVAPFAAIGFPAPIVNENIDVAMLARFQLQPVAFPNPNDTPTPTAVPSATPNSTVAPTATSTVAAVATTTPSNTAAPTITSTATFTPLPTDTPTATPTSTNTSTPTPLMLGAVNIVDQTQNFQNNTGSFVGQCRDQGKTVASAALAPDGSQISTTFSEVLVADCEVTLGDRTANLTTDYIVEFDVWCPNGAPYTLDVATSLNGALTLREDEDAGCSGGVNGASDGNLGTVTGAVLQGGLITSGSLDLPGTSSGNCSCTLLGCTGCQSTAIARSGTATITGTGTGAPIRHRLEFTWAAACTSNGSTWTQGAECALRLGLESGNTCMYGDNYPGNPPRTKANDGHFVTITGSCGSGFTPTPTSTPPPTVTPGGPTLTPTPTPTVTPPASPLGTLIFQVDDGPGVLSGGSTTCPGCPGASATGSLLKTHGNPTGGFCNSCNGSRGDFSTIPSTGIELFGGAPDANGVASLSLARPVVVRVKLPPATPNCSNCDSCWRLEQDPAGTGWVDCDGGSAADVRLEVISNGSAAPPAAVATLVGPFVVEGADAGPGAAILLARVKKFRGIAVGTCPAPDDVAAWQNPDDEFSAVLTTATATARIGDPRKCSGNTFGTQCPSTNPYEVVLSGSNFDCANWVGAPGPTLALPLNVLDDPIGGSFADGDIASVLRLEQFDGVSQQ